MRRITRLFISALTIFTLFSSVKSVSHAESIKAPYTTLSVRETINADEESFVSLGVGSAAESISDIKSNSKKLLVKLVQVRTDKTNGGKWYTVELYSKKKGIYKASDIYTAVDGSQKKKILRVRVTNDEPCESVKIRGKKLTSKSQNFLSFKSGKLLVKMNKGYKLKKIELKKYATLKQEFGENEWEIKKIKNGSKIAISNVPFHARYGIYGETGLGSEYKSCVAESELIITYVDQYSKKEKQISYMICKRLI